MLLLSQTNYNQHALDNEKLKEATNRQTHCNDATIAICFDRIDRRELFVVGCCWFKLELLFLFVVRYICCSLLLPLSCFLSGRMLVRIAATKNCIRLTIRFTYMKRCVACTQHILLCLLAENIRTPNVDLCQLAKRQPQQQRNYQFITFCMQMCKTQNDDDSHCNHNISNTIIKLNNIICST